MKLRLVLIFLLVLLVGACGSNSKTVKTEVGTTLKQTLDSYLTANIEDDSPGVSILVIKNGVTEYIGSKGMANSNAGQKITADSGFKLASVSKVFTALAILQLHEQEKLSLDESILIFLPELSLSWKDINIHHLLTHQSGIPDWVNDIDFYSWPDYVNNQDVISFFSQNDALHFESGSDARYSNTGYILLAEIVSRVSGLSFADYMRINIFEPAGMLNSYINDNISITKNDTALNYAEFPTQFERHLFVNGSSGMVSSANDLQKFVIAYLNGSIIGSNSIRLMLTHHTVKMEEVGNLNYGYGAVLAPSSTNQFFHGGGLDGFQTDILIDITSESSIIFLSNGGDATAHQNIVKDLVSSFFASQ